MIPVIITVEDKTAKIKSGRMALVKCLTGIEKHTRDYLSIVCIDGKHDETAKAALQYKNRVVNMNVVPIKRTALLNYGLATAKQFNTDYVAFLSPKAQVNGPWLKAMVRVIEQNTVVGAVTAASEGLSFDCALFSTYMLNELRWQLDGEVATLSIMKKLDWKVANIDLPVVLPAAKKK